VERGPRPGALGVIGGGSATGDIFWALELVGLSFLSAFWLNIGKRRISIDPPSMEGTHTLEIWYLIPPLHATIVAIQLLFGPIVAKNPTSHRFMFFPEWQRANGESTLRSWTASHILFVISLILPTILGIGLDRFWCWAIHSRQSGGTFLFFLWDLFTASTITFLGCDMAYLAILLWLDFS